MLQPWASPLTGDAFHRGSLYTPVNSHGASLHWLLWTQILTWRSRFWWKAVTKDHMGDTVVFHKWTRRGSQALIVQNRLILANFHRLQQSDSLAPHTLYISHLSNGPYLPLAWCLQKHGLARLSDLSLVGVAVWGIVWTAAGSSSERLSLRKMIFLNWALWIFDICFHTMPSLKNLKGQFSPMENNRLELCKFKQICCLYFLSTGGERNPQTSLVQPACRLRF